MFSLPRDIRPSVLDSANLAVDSGVDDTFEREDSGEYVFSIYE